MSKQNIRISAGVEQIYDPWIDADILVSRRGKEELFKQRYTYDYRRGLISTDRQIYHLPHDACAWETLPDRKVPKNIKSAFSNEGRVKVLNAICRQLRKMGKPTFKFLK